MTIDIHHSTLQKHGPALFPEHYRDTKKEQTDGDKKHKDKTEQGKARSTSVSLKFPPKNRIQKFRKTDSKETNASCGKTASGALSPLNYAKPTGSSKTPTNRITVKRIS